MRSRKEYKYGVKGLYIGDVDNIITDRDPDFITLPFCTTEKPEPKENQVAVINNDNITWKYVEDKSGNWYNIKTKELVILSEYDYDYDTSNFTKEVPPSYDDFIVWNGKKWIESKGLKEIYEKEVQSKKIKNNLNNLDSKSIRSLTSLMLYLIDKLGKEDLETNPALKDDFKFLLQNYSEVSTLREELQTINTVDKVKKNG